ncbi:MAG: hypothetical protein IJA95_01215 [Bacteroidaceae bacterium]|nr:hypothetical protein [Bacteroidaceae bacterium]
MSPHGSHPDCEKVKQLKATVTAVRLESKSYQIKGFLDVFNNFATHHLVRQGFGQTFHYRNCPEEQPFGYPIYGYLGRFHAYLFCLTAQNSE